ncbi:MAG: 50S ribosomal protein L5 [Clostridia bacterium]|nr:50S ribosomal protein L5 [Bacillota bacterium]MBO2520872.1 50S ribosomal protein L5 [Bacillota bacterium]
MSRLKERYLNEVVPELIKRFGYRNPMQVPKLEKIVINMGVGDAAQDPKALDVAMQNLAMITGQKPAVTRAKKSIANFKLREGMPIGCRVTLRGQRMYDFLDKLINVSLPRIRDFRGVSPKSFDGRGNYNLGIREQLIFPEVDYDSIDKIRGMDIAIVTTAKTDEEAYELLARLGMPFRAA